MLLWAVVHSIFEEEIGDAYPVVQHVFFGKTHDEAMSYYKAHLTTDAFLRGCQASGRWNGVRCHTAIGTFRYDTLKKTFLEP